MTTIEVPGQKRGRGRPRGSLNKRTLDRLLSQQEAQASMPIISSAQTLREDKLRLSGSLRPRLEKYSDDARAVKAFSRVGNRYLNEAAQALRDHPKMNPAWKRNIMAFLQRCLNEVPYIANWHWAIHALKTFKKVYAPFRYFKMCLFFPTKLRMARTDPETREKAKFMWLKKTKGVVAARSWAAKYAGAWYNTRRLVNNRSKWQRTVEYAARGKAAVDTAREEEAESLSPIEIYERQRAELKALEYAKGWVDDGDDKGGYRN